MFNAIYFDLFNTLLHFDFRRLPKVRHRGKELPSTLPGVLQIVRRHLDPPPTEEELIELFFDVSDRLEREKRAEDREFLSEVRFDRFRRELGIGDSSATERMVSAHMGEMFQTMYLPEANRRALERLGAFRKYVASNFDHPPTALRALEQTKILPHFDEVFISGDLGWRKPSERFFGQVLAATGDRADQCLFVGDDPTADLAGASRAGFQVAWLPLDSQAKSEIVPLLRLETLSDLPEFLRA